jgi:hypothetical protein
MKKSFLFLLTWYKRIRYIEYVESKNQWQIKTQNDRQTRSYLKTNGRLGKPFKNVFPLLLSKKLLRSRNASIKILVLPIKFWLLPKHWQNRQKIKALVLCSAAEGQPLPFLKSLRSNLTMNHFSIFVNGTSALLHAHGGV